MRSDPPSHVLFVDDDEEAGEMLSLLLKPQQIEVTCAQSAGQAWLKIKAEYFDLYLLDAWLPQLDGFELCWQIRQCDSTTPIVFYSGAAYDADKKEGIAAGANAYVAKPDLDSLIETMVDLISQATAADVTALGQPPAPFSRELAFNLSFFATEAATD
jgi:DNA-binding response OmpR family regulator